MLSIYLISQTLCFAKARKETGEKRKTGKTGKRKKIGKMEISEILVGTYTHGSAACVETICNQEENVGPEITNVRR